MQRTELQNRSMHKFFRMVADQCQEQGISQQALFEARSIDVPVTEHAIKSLWHSIQNQLYGQVSTTELSRSQVNTVYEALITGMGQKLGLGYVPFPSEDEREE